MKKFNFTLDPLLKYRDYMEHKARLEVSRALADLTASRDRISSLDETLEKTGVLLDHMTSSGIDSGKLMRYSEYISSLGYEIEIEKENELRLQSVLVDRQKELKKKSIERKALENLKENRKVEYNEEMVKEIQNESDDMTLIRRAGEAGK